MIIYGLRMTTIDREAGPPPWRQLAAILRARIRAGEFDGSRLPSQRYIADQYGLAVGTVRKALGLLEEEGLISTERGWGSAVRKDAGEGSPPSSSGEPS